MIYTKEQVENMKLADAKYLKWMKAHEESSKVGQELLSKLKMCVGSTGNNYAAVEADLNKAYAQLFREMD